MNKWAGIVIGLIAIVAVGVLFWPKDSKPPEPPLIFDFDDGTLQSWTMTKGAMDDTGKEYNSPAGTIWLTKWYDQHQYPTNFPGTDPKGDKKGCFSFGNAGLELNKIGFPSTSKHWQVDLTSPYLTSLFTGKDSVTAYLGEKYSIYPSKIEAAIYLQIHTEGASKTLPSEGGVFTSIGQKGWKKVTGTFALPSDAVIQHIIIRVRGSNPGLYEGGVYLDHVEANKRQPK